MLIIVFLITCVSAYGLSMIAKSVGLVAQPDKYRQHEKDTALLGGVAILLGLVVGTFLFAADYARLLPSLVLLCIVGLLDDQWKLPSWVRFVMQASAVYLMIKLTGVQLQTLGALIIKVVVLPEWFVIPMTIFAAIGVINAINMSDGMDGLAGSLCVLVLIALLLSGHAAVDLLWVSILAIAGFLVWNIRVYKPSARIFMGDAGSTMLGLLLAYFLISGSQSPQMIFSPVTALWFLALPLFDAVAVLIVRPLRGKSPFLADRIHYHHLIHDAGISVNNTLLIILVVQSLFVSVGFLFNYFAVADNIQLFMFLAFFMIYLFNLFKRTR